MKQQSKKEIKIIYEDNHLLVVEKPFNIASQGDITGDPDMLYLLKDYLKNKYNKPGNVFLGLVHRLDRPAGGCMVFAKTSKAASRLSEQIRQRTFGKTYIAVIHGVPENHKGELKHFLVKDNKKNKVYAVQHDNKDAKQALLEYKLLGAKENLSLVEIRLLTGRPHQIRVQFSTIGHPLFGDKKYGEVFEEPGSQLALWSSSITLIHPTTKQEMTFQSSPPGIYPWNLFYP